MTVWYETPPSSVEDLGLWGLNLIYIFTNTAIHPPTNPHIHVDEAIERFLKSTLGTLKQEHEELQAKYDGVAKVCTLRTKGFATYNMYGMYVA